MSPESNQDVEIVVLTNAASELEAMMWAEILREAGIQVLLRSGGPGAGAWASAATFDHNILVRSDQLDRARDILGSVIANDQPWPRVRKSAPVVNRVIRRRSVQ